MRHLTQAEPLATSKVGAAKTAALRGRAQAPKLSDRNADLFSTVARLSRPGEMSYSTKAQALGTTAVPSKPKHWFTCLGSAGGGSRCSSQRGINHPRATVTVRPNPSLKLTRYGRLCKPGLRYSLYILSVRAYKACLRGQLSSNVRHATKSCSGTPALFRGHGPRRHALRMLLPRQLRPSAAHTRASAPASLQQHAAQLNAASRNYLCDGAGSAVELHRACPGIFLGCRVRSRPAGPG